jgi:hypothetical protein
MRRFHALHLVVFLLVFTACGCPSNNKGKIEGTKWISEAATVKGVTLPAGMLSLEFKKDGTLRASARGRTVTGNYSLGWGDFVTLNFDQPLVTGKTHRETIVIKGNRMTMSDPDGTSMTFRKQ